MIIILTFNDTQGGFFYTRTNGLGRRFTVDFDINSIDLFSPGRFEIFFHVMMWCGNLAQSCASFGDSITLIIDANTPNQISFSVDHTNIEEFGAWKKKNFAFSTQSKSIQVQLIKRLVSI